MPLTLHTRQQGIYDAIGEYLRVLEGGYTDDITTVLATPLHAFHMDPSPGYKYYHLCIVPDNAFKYMLNRKGMVGMYFTHKLISMYYKWVIT